MVSAQLETPDRRLSAEFVQFTRNGDDQFVMTAARFDVQTGEALEPVVTELLLSDVDAQIAQAQATLDNLTALREVLLSAPAHQAAQP